MWAFSRGVRTWRRHDAVHLLLPWSPLSLHFSTEPIAYRFVQIRSLCYVVAEILGWYCFGFLFPFQLFSFFFLIKTTEETGWSLVYLTSVTSEGRRRKSSPLISWDPSLCCPIFWVVRLSIFSFSHCTFLTLYRSQNNSASKWGELDFVVKSP